MTTLLRWCITGAGAGIGRAIAHAALARGDTVFGLLRDPAQRAEFLSLAPGRAFALMGDVTRDEDLTEAAERIAGSGPLDVLVNNAGVGMVGAVEETSLSQARALFEVNFFGLMATTKAMLPLLKRSRGRIINISSGVGLYGLPGMPIYSASKHAVEGLSDALSGELAPWGVRVCLLEPGAVATGFAVDNAMEAAAPDPAYAAMTGGGRESLRKYYNTGASDPATVAQAVLAIADAADPPPRTVLGTSKKSAMFKRDALDAAIDRAK